MEKPWTPEQIQKLNEFQHCGHMHPFTCPNRGEDGHDVYALERGHHDVGILLATENGWLCPVCGYTQDWAHSFMFEGAPPKSW